MNKRGEISEEITTLKYLEVLYGLFSYLFLFSALFFRSSINLFHSTHFSFNYLTFLQLDDWASWWPFLFIFFLKCLQQGRWELLHRYFACLYRKFVCPGDIVSSWNQKSSIFRSVSTNFLQIFKGFFFFFWHSCSFLYQFSRFNLYSVQIRKKKFSWVTGHCGTMASLLSNRPHKLKCSYPNCSVLLNWHFKLITTNIYILVRS